MPEQHEDAPGTAEAAPEAPESSETTEEPGDGDGATEEDTSELARVRREAAGHRKRLREAEAERDTATERSDALLDEILAAECRPYGIAPRALTLAEKDPAAWFGPDGFDRAALRADISEVAQIFGARKPGVSPHTGTGSERESVGATWSDALKR